MKKPPGTRFLGFVIYTLAMSELMILAVALTAFAAIGGLVYGIRAVQLSQHHSNRFTLRLAALNLLEPSVTISVFFAVGFATNAFNSSEMDLLPLAAGLPLTVMLLAPLVTRVKSPLQRVIAVYGLLRWLNTIALAVIALTAGDQFISDDTRLMLGIALIALGLVLLIASVLHIGSSLEAAKPQTA